MNSPDPDLWSETHFLSSASPRLRVNQEVGELTRRREVAEDEP